MLPISSLGNGFQGSPARASIRASADTSIGPDTSRQNDWRESSCGYLVRCLSTLPLQCSQRQEGLPPLLETLSLTGQGMGQNEDRLGWGPNHCNLIGHEEGLDFLPSALQCHKWEYFLPSFPSAATAQEQGVADSESRFCWAHSEHDSVLYFCPASPPSR